MGKYEEALERAKQGLPIDEVFPELKESEDEKIRKILIHIVKGACDKYGIKYRGDEIDQEKLLAYLEKQKEQKPNVELIQKSWYLEGYHDGKYNNEPKWLIQTGKGGPMYEENPKYGTQNPAEWSEEDENYYDTIVRKLQVIGDDSGLTLNQIDFLDKHRPKPHWKPSEKQMKALKVVAKGFPADDPDAIDSLLTDLQKLI